MTVAVLLALLVLTILADNYFTGSNR